MLPFLKKQNEKEVLQPARYKDKYFLERTTTRSTVSLFFSHHLLLLFSNCLVRASNLGELSISFIRTSQSCLLVLPCFNPGLIFPVFSLHPLIRHSTLFNWVIASSVRLESGRSRCTSKHILRTGRINFEIKNGFRRTPRTLIRAFSKKYHYTL